MRSRGAHYCQVLGLAMGIWIAANARADFDQNPWPVTTFVTDPYREGQSLRAAAPARIGAPTSEDTLLSFDASVKFQEIEGYGAAITDSSLIAIGKLPSRKRAELLEKLFHPKRGLNINYLRIPIGATDFGVASYTYLDLPPGQVDPQLKRFSFHRARKLVAFLRRVKRINPNLRILLSPWSPPAWMKTSGRLNGGSLKPEYYGAFAGYLLKSVRSFEAAGVPVDSITIQNEPFHSTEQYPSMEMSAEEQISFIRDHLFPAFKAARVKTKILGLDHNYDLRSEGDAIYTALGNKIAGIAYHCYGGTFDQMQGSSAPLFQTECSGGTWGDGPGTLHFWLQSQVIGGGLLGSRLAMGWNLALDQDHGPYFGYCGNCRGLVDIDTNTKNITFNPELIAMAHAGKFLGRGAYRIATAAPIDDGYSTIAYVNRDSSVLQVVENKGPAARSFVLATPNGDFFQVNVPAGGAASILIPAR